MIACGLTIGYLSAHTFIVFLSIHLRSNKEVSMGQLLGLPISNDNGISDKRPKSLSECYVNEEFNALLVQQYRKRSYDDSRRVLIDILFSKQSSVSSVVDEEEDDGINTTLDGLQVGEPAEQVAPAEKRRRTRDKKHGVTYVDSHTGERLRLYPKMSTW